MKETKKKKLIDVLIILKLLDIVNKLKKKRKNLRVQNVGKNDKNCTFQTTNCWRETGTIIVDTCQMQEDANVGGDL